MAYRMTLPVFDNSAVNTRQVRRHRERLSRKKLPGSSVRTRADVMDASRSYVFSTSRYMPHNGKREMARRVAQQALIASGNTRASRRWALRGRTH